jgi:hypothetical protein
MEKKMGPKEAAQREMREHRAREAEKVQPRVKGKAIGKLQNIKALKTTGRGR